MTPTDLKRLADHLFQYSAALSPKDYEQRLREFNWPASEGGRPLHAIPSSELVAELNARRERSPVEVREVPGPSPQHPVRYGICRDGDTYRKAGEHVLRQRYIALCDNPTEARLLASLINDTDTARMQAAKE